MENLSFRKLQEKDHEEVISMFLDFYKEDKGIVCVSEINIRKTISHWSQFPQAGCIYTFHRNDKIIGYANFIFYWSNEYGGEIINLDELFIKKEYRNKGTALEFLLTLNSLFGESIVGYELEIHPDNKSVISLYQRAGFVQNENTFMLKLK